MSESTAPRSQAAQASRVLIVDDQRNMRATTALVLRQAGYEVIEAESGEAALSRLLAEPFDVVLTDLKMAPLDGTAVLRGALEISSTTQVVVMTAYGTVESAVAVKLRRCLLEEASGGTFFFDEIAETTPAFQAKLLRVIQEHEIRRVGDNASIAVDVRVLAATNQDLRRAIADKRFREDLFYRLNVVPLVTPPLRERRDDIPVLAQHFVERFNQRNGTRRA